MTALTEPVTASATTVGSADGWAIRSVGLAKRFGDVAVVEGLDLQVPVGSVFGFLGPNGCGKTTTIRMILGLIAASEGSITLLGTPMPSGAADALPRVGALVEGPAFYPWLSGRQNLARLDAAAPHADRATRSERIDAALKRVGLSAAGSKKFRAYSLGMRQRLGLANALLEHRDLLILDEPTNGMDPQGTREIRHLIRELAADGTTVFLSSHLLAEIEQICTHVAVMNLGQLLWQGSLVALQEESNPVVRVETVDVDAALEVLRSQGLEPFRADNGIAADLRDRVPEDLCRLLIEQRVRVSGFTVARPSLEDMFVALTGEGFDVAR
jgi:ABC-2 type transport system ATP-binding protein